MSIIYTKNNVVYAEEPQRGDVACRVMWMGPPPDGGPYFKQFRGPIQPIDEYDECVQWAVSMADYMAYYMYVFVMSANEVIEETKRCRTPTNLESLLCQLALQMPR